MLLVGFSVGLGVLLLVWAVLAIRRALAFAANRTFLAVLVWQFAFVVTAFVWSATTSRPDLVRWPGWAAIGMVAFVVPFAVGALLDKQAPGRRRWAPKVVSVVLVAVTLLGSVGTVAAAIAPTLTQTTVAGGRVPVTADTLANGFSMAVHIPATSSGFSARDANLWVPPGWILHPDVRRPVVEMTMGQPGDPNLDATLNALHSLGQSALESAPFVLVVDPLGGRHLNPPCRNTVAGQVTTYLAVDVPRWIRANLPVPSARSYWTIAGYSYGGDCAEFLEATYPSKWANMISVSGPDVPGTGNVPYAIAHYFGGSQATFDAALTATALKKHGHYPNTVATFATGELDKKYGPGVIYVASLADQEGWHVSTLVVKHAGHIGATLQQGLEFGYRTLKAKGRFPTDGATPGRYLCPAQSSPSACSSQQLATFTGTIALVDLTMVMLFFGVSFIVYFRRLPKPTSS